MDCLSTTSSDNGMIPSEMMFLRLGWHDTHLSPVIAETGICLVWGRTHFLTYDGVSHDWRGNCIYTFIKTCGPLSHGLKQFHLTGDFDPITVTKKIFGLKRVRLHYDGHEYRIEENRVLLDGLEVTLPLHHNGVFIYLRPIFTVRNTNDREFLCCINNCDTAMLLFTLSY